MFTLRCTQKLLRRGLVETAGADVPPTTLLGDWYAHVLVARQHTGLVRHAVAHTAHGRVPCAV